MSGVDEDYERLLLSSWDKANEQVRHIIYRERKVSVSNHPRFHTIENHVYHMEKYGKCVYCENGSKLLSAEEINMEFEKQ